jgi:hypothetical protein
MTRDFSRPFLKPLRLTSRHEAGTLLVSPTKFITKGVAGRLMMSVGVPDCGAGDRRQQACYVELGKSGRGSTGFNGVQRGSTGFNGVQRGSTGFNGPHMMVTPAAHYATLRTAMQVHHERRGGALDDVGGRAGLRS